MPEQFEISWLACSWTKIRGREQESWVGEWILEAVQKVRTRGTEQLGFLVRKIYSLV